MSKVRFFNGTGYSDYIEVVDGMVDYTYSYEEGVTTRYALGVWPEGSCFDQRIVLENKMSQMVVDNPERFMELRKAIKDDPLCFPIAEKVWKWYKQKH